MFRKVLAALIAAVFVVIGTAGVAEAKTTLKMATLAPPPQPVGQGCSRPGPRRSSRRPRARSWSSGSGTEPGGPEGGVVGKIKSGQLSGAAITAIGLSAIDKRFIALQMPGTFDSWKELDRARETLAKDILGDEELKKRFPRGGLRRPSASAA